MARTTDIIGLECDRCHAKAYEASGSPHLANWIDIERTDVNGSKQKWLLCHECYAVYRSIMNTMDSEFNDFIRNKTDGEAS